VTGKGGKQGTALDPEMVGLRREDRGGETCSYQANDAQVGVREEENWGLSTVGGTPQKGGVDHEGKKKSLTVEKISRRRKGRKKKPLGGKVRNLSGVELGGLRRRQRPKKKKW